jgi:tRNA (guanosine-2'-O-)-methyltransferase
LLACAGLGCQPGAHAPGGARRDAFAAAAAGGAEASAAPHAEPADAEPRVRAIEPCLPQSYEICFNALDDNCNGALEEGCGVPAGVVQFMIGWDALRADVDLNVTDPNGELIEAGRVARSGLIKTRDCPGRRQECSGVNLENVFLEGNKAPTRGTYRVSVALESLGGEQPPIWVNLSSRLGARRYAFEIRLLAPEDERHVELTL